MFKFVLTRAFFSPKAVILFFSGFVSQFNLLLANQISAYVRETGTDQRPLFLVLIKIFAASGDENALGREMCFLKCSEITRVLYDSPMQGFGFAACFMIYSTNPRNNNPLSDMVFSVGYSDETAFRLSERVFPQSILHKLALLSLCMPSGFRHTFYHPFPGALTCALPVRFLLEFPCPDISVSTIFFPRPVSSSGPS